MSDDLVVRWQALLQPIDGSAAGDDLLRRWAEPHRRYHDLAHLRAVLDRIDELVDEATHPDDVRLAAYFHDAVYDPADADNEARSAELAESVLATLGLDAQRVARVSRLVRGTAAHRPEPPDELDSAVLFDADLAILAASPQAYAAYAAAVRTEYAAVPDAAFRAGRTRVLRDLLDRPRLFWTESGRRRYEDLARHNVSTELALLAAGAHGSGSDAASG